MIDKEMFKLASLRIDGRTMLALENFK